MKDSLDTNKIRGRLILELQNKNIENLEGLQYFNKVWRLIVYQNRIKSLNHLPPNLTFLFCSYNQIEHIDSLPEGLTFLACENNKIKYIQKLPKSLISLRCANNLLVKLPEIPKSVQYLNYAQNPIKTKLLPKNLQAMPCKSIQQNCVPYDLINWEVLNCKKSDTSFHLTGFQINIMTNNSWGFNGSDKTFDYTIRDDSAVNVNSRIIKNRKDGKDTLYESGSNSSIVLKQMESLVMDIVNHKMIIEIQTNDTTFTIDLSRLKNGQPPCGSDCKDCGYYVISYSFYTEKDTIDLNYNFRTDLKFGDSFCEADNQYFEIRVLLDFIYQFKLMQLINPAEAENISARNIFSNHVNKEILIKLSELTMKK